MQVVTGGKAANNVSKLKQPEMHRAKQNIIKEITISAFTGFQAKPVMIY